MTPYEQVSVAVIGGTGLYDLELNNVKQLHVSTPFGEPSDAITIGNLDGIQVAFLPRHGRHHQLSPTEIPARANIHALKQLGAQRIISVSAVGSLKLEIKPMDLVIPDQLIDRTRLRENTFFTGGLVAHIPFADPFCPDLNEMLATSADESLSTSADESLSTAHRGGSLLVIEGPTFSTRAESLMYRAWGASIIGMTALPEAKLAREAEMCYSILACVTDYDVWNTEQADVTVEVIVDNLRKNVATSRDALRRVIPLSVGPRNCGCGFALKSALVTDLGQVPQETLNTLGPIVSNYVP